MKKLIALSLSLLLALPAMAADISISIDGAPFTATNSMGATVEPIMSDDSVYLPLRAIGEALGKSVEWDNERSFAIVGETPKIFDDILFTVNGEAVYTSETAYATDENALVSNTAVAKYAADNNLVAQGALDSFDEMAKSKWDEMIKGYADNYGATVEQMTAALASSGLSEAGYKAGVVKGLTAQLVSLPDDAKNLAAEAVVDKSAATDRVVGKIGDWYITSSMVYNFGGNLETAKLYCAGAQKALEAGVTVDEKDDFGKAVALCNALFDKMNTEGAFSHEADNEFVTVRHILCADEAKAKEVIAKLESGSDITELIEEYNTDPGQTKDSFYTFTKGEMVEPFEKASFALEVGKYTTEAVKSDFGYHVIERYELDTDAAAKRQAAMNETQSSQEFGALLGTYVTESEYSEYTTNGVFVDGKKISARDANGKLLPVINIDGTLYLPVRAISEAMGLKVNWNNDSRTVELTR